MRRTGFAVIVARVGGLVVAGPAPETAAQGRAGRSATVGVPSATRQLLIVGPGEMPVTVERDGARQEFQILANGPQILTPIVIFPD